MISPNRERETQRAFQPVGVEGHMEGAFTGQYLRVNLTQGTTAVERFSDVDYSMFMGGAAMASAILMRELKPGVDPLGPENLLVFATGPLNGLPLAGTSRFTVVGKSPLTGGYGEGEAGAGGLPS